ncbi:unnamed protein product [Paramecium pentaurelia]|uniref:Uncharacterized protein n=1 Tax=Paramecium pentaurelia TaxID=43138 RepID=A0A8S1SGY1_9CILI|nr:unnamed protein product [Paramecium pentaurelia]
MRILQFCIQNYNDIKFIQIRIQINSMNFPNKVQQNKWIDVHLIFLIDQRIHQLSDENKMNSNCYSCLKTALKLFYTFFIGLSQRCICWQKQKLYCIHQFQDSFTFMNWVVIKYFYEFIF